MNPLQGFSKIETLAPARAPKKRRLEYYSPSWSVDFWERAQRFLSLRGTTLPNASLGARDVSIFSRNVISIERGSCHEAELGEVRPLCTSFRLAHRCAAGSKGFPCPLKMESTPSRLLPRSKVRQLPACEWQTSQGNAKLRTCSLFPNIPAGLLPASKLTWEGEFQL